MIVSDKTSIQTTTIHQNNDTKSKNEKVLNSFEQMIKEEKAKEEEQERQDELEQLIKDKVSLMTYLLTIQDVEQLEKKKEELLKKIKSKAISLENAKKELDEISEQLDKAKGKIDPLFKPDKLGHIILKEKMKKEEEEEQNKIKDT